MRRSGVSWYSVARRLLVESEDPHIKYSKIIEKIDRFFGIITRVRFKNDSSMWGEIKDDGTIHVGAKVQGIQYSCWFTRLFIKHGVFLMDQSLEESTSGPIVTKITSQSFSPDLSLKRMLVNALKTSEQLKSGFMLIRPTS